MPRQEFTASVKAAALARERALCAGCSIDLELELRIEFDHIIPCELGGGAQLDNCQPLCVTCHRRKTRRDIKLIAKSRRIRHKLLHGRCPRQPFYGWRKFNGEVVRNPRKRN